MNTLAIVLHHSRVVVNRPLVWGAISLALGFSATALYVAVPASGADLNLLISQQNGRIYLLAALLGLLKNLHDILQGNRSPDRQIPPRKRHILAH